MTHQNPAGLRAACRELPDTTGGVEAARLLVDLAARSGPPQGLAEHGPWGPPTWRRALPDPRTPVTWPSAEGEPGAERRGRHPLRLTEELPAHRVGQDPLEHLVEGASAEYRRARADIARWIYR